MSTRGARRAPEPPGWPLLGHALELLRRPGDFLLEVVRDYGPSVSLRYGTTRALLVSSPSAVREVLVDQSDRFTKGYEEMKIVLGEGLLTSEGDHWLRHRKLMTSLFKPEAVASFTPALIEATEEMLVGWEARCARGETIDAHAELTYLAFRIAGLTLFGIDLRDKTVEVCDAATAMTRALFELGTSPINYPMWIPTKRNRALDRSIKKLDEVFLRIRSQHDVGSRGSVVGDRGSPTTSYQSPTTNSDVPSRPNMVSLLVNAKDANGVRLDEREIRDETVTLLLAGHETTANILSWTMMLLAQNVAEAERLHQRIGAFAGGAPLAPEDIPELRWAVLEAMRLYPPGWLFERRATTDTTIDGYSVPSGSRVALCPWVTHRSPSLWPNPDAFIPERFTNENVKARDRYSYLPFGAGPRQCIGMSFALAETHVILSMILQRFRFRLAPSARLDPEFVLTLRPRYGLPIELERL